MNMRLTMIVVCVALILGGAAAIKVFIIDARSGGTSSQANGSDVGRLLDPLRYSPELVRIIRIDRPASTDYQFQFDEADGVWRQTEPIPYLMEDFPLRGLAAAAGDLVVSRTIAPRDLQGDLAPAQLQLDPPAAALTFTLADQTTFELQLGRRLMAGQAYVRLDVDGPVFLVGDAVHKRVFDRDPMAWRNRAVFPGLGQEVSRIRIDSKREDGRVALQRIGRTWYLSEPVRALGDAQEVARLINRLASANVFSFAVDSAADFAAYGLTDPHATITLEIDRPQADGGVNTERHVLRIGDPVDLAETTARFARRDERMDVFTLSSRTVASLSPLSIELVSRVVVPATAENVRAITVRTSTGSFSLERSVDSWMLIVHDGAGATAADTDRVTALLDLLTVPQEVVEFGTLSDLLGIDDEMAVTEIVIDTFQSSEFAAIRLADRVIDDEPAATTIFDDGSGVLRYTLGQVAIDLAADDFHALDPAEAVGDALVGAPDNADDEPIK